MRKIALPYINEFRDRHGKTRRYFRRNGITISFRAQPETTEFLVEYQEAIDRSAPSKDGAGPKPITGTWNDLIATYYKSAAYSTKIKSDRARAENRREAERIRVKWGKHPVVRLEPRHIRKWQDELAATPGKANNMLAMVKLLLNFAKGYGFKHNDPAASIDELPGGSYRSWTNAEIASFEKRWPLGTRERLIFDLALYTGQRRGDLAAMTRAHFDGGVMGCAQEKTGERIAVPVHPNLAASMTAFPTKGMAIIQRLDGKPLKVRELHDVIATAIDAAGLPDDCVLHGLRYSAARCLADAGATAHEIMAVTGHKTLDMVEQYTKQANKVRLAGSAMEKLTAWRTRTERESYKP